MLAGVLYNLLFYTGSFLLGGDSSHFNKTASCLYFCLNKASAVLFQDES